MIGQTINNRYKVSGRIGKGAMGTVFHATDSLTGQEVAVKVISGDLALDPEVLERFKREGEALRKLKHPNIVGYLDAFQHAEQYVIVMEYVSGGSLHELIKAGLLPIERARQIALDLCDALIRAHRLNIIHRDIKPENILIDEEGTPKLADFGVARLSEGTRMTRSGTQVGTPYYMAPEAWKGEALDARADIWSLGVVLFEMLSGQVPFDGDTGPAVMTKVFTMQAPDLKKLRADVPSALVRIVGRMLIRDKNKRYQTIRQVGVDLEGSELGAPPRPIKSERRIFTSGKYGAFLSVRNLFMLGILLVGAFIAFKLLPLTGGLVPDPTQGPTGNAVSETSSTAISEKDGMSMVFIPDGQFIMGHTAESDCVEFVVAFGSCPTHEVYLGPFWLDRTEITNGMYASCVRDGACEVPERTSSTTQTDYFRNEAFADYPVIHVDWQRAFAYCSWAGRRLPTEAEWEKAARGTAQQSFPWGNQSPQQSLGNYGYFVGDTTPVGSYPSGASPYGALDLGGNVLEWVADWYDELYYFRSPDTNPLGPEDGELRVLRGGAWNSSTLQSFQRFKYDPAFSSDFVGFRCARTP